MFFEFILVAPLSCHLVIANSTLPVVHQAVRNQRIGEDCQADRMTIWLQNVESMSARIVSFDIIFTLSFISRGRR